MKNKTLLTMFIALGVAVGSFLLCWLAASWLDEKGLMVWGLVLFMISVIVASVRAQKLWLMIKIMKSLDRSKVGIVGDSHLTGTFYAWVQDGIVKEFFAGKCIGPADASKTKRDKKTHVRFI